MVPNTRNKTPEERTIDELCREIKVLSDMNKAAFSNGFLTGVFVMFVGSMIIIEILL